MEGPVNEGDFILQCTIQLDGGSKRRSAVKVSIAGHSPGGCRAGEEEEKAEDDGGRRGRMNERRNAQCRLREYVQTRPAQ